MLRSDSSCFFFWFVEGVHRGNDAFVNCVLQRVRCAIDCRCNERSFFLKKTTQHVIDRSLAGGRADPNAQPWNLVGAKLHEDRFKSVVAAGAPTQAQSKPAKWQSEIVEHHKDFLRTNFVELRDGMERLATAVHVSHRLDQNYVVVLGNECAPLCRSFPGRSKLRGQAIGHEKTDVVPRLLVFAARISQTGNQANRWSFFFHIRSIENRRSQMDHFFDSFSLGVGAAGAPFAAGAPLPVGPGAAASPSSFFSLITSGPAAAPSASATTGSSSTTGATTENAVRSGCTFTVTPAGSLISRT